MDWRTAMNEDIKRYFDLPADAVIEDIDTDQETRGYGGCPTCRWTVFMVKVTYRPDPNSYTQTATYEGSLSDFLTMVAEKAALGNDSAEDADEDSDEEFAEDTADMWPYFIS